MNLETHLGYQQPGACFVIINKEFSSADTMIITRALITLVNMKQLKGFFFTSYRPTMIFKADR